MSRKSILYFVGLLLLTLPMSGCKKVEGPGGAATIQGRIFITEYDSAENAINSYFAPKFDVYIIYGEDGDETYFDDDVETSYDGTFKFRFLEPGKYRIFFYEDCNNSQLPTRYSGKVVTIKEVTINDKKDVVDLGTMDVYERF